MKLQDQTAPVYAETDGPVGRVILNRPEKRNAMSLEMWAAIPALVDYLDKDPDVRVILMTSGCDKAFSAGADIAELQQIAADPVKREENRAAIRDAQRTLMLAKKPTIAQIEGACVGGGCGLAIHCDFRIAAFGAKFGITPAKLGIVYPLNDTRQLVNLVGAAQAKRMLFTGAIFSAEQALHMGLVDECVTPDRLAQAVGDLTAQLVSVSQYSVQQMKLNIQKVLDGQQDDDSHTIEQFLRAHDGEDAQEGIRAFLEKRPADFTWSG